MVTTPALFAAIVVAFFAGWHIHKWRYAENDLQGARARLANALKAAWRARWWAVGAAAVVWLLAYKWTHGTG